MAKAKRSISQTLVWILLALLILGLAGFGATNFSGTVGSVGRVGDTEITTTAYARALQNEMQAMQAQTGQPMSIQQAQEQGLTQAVLSRLVVRAALEDEADRIGISVGDERLAADLAAIQAFQGPDGQFDREAYRFALRNAGLSEAEFEADLRAESAATLLQAAVLAGVVQPDTYVDTLVSYAAEQRDFTWARLGPRALDTLLPAPTEERLRAFYDENIDAYTSPRAKLISYAWITPDMILDTVEVPEDALHAAYDEQSDRFNMPERRLVERLVMPDAEAAEDAAARIASGETTFENVVEVRGLTLADTDMGDVARGDLGDAAEAVFGAEVGETIVAPSPVGPALYRVNGVLAAQETPFDEAVPMLRDTLALDRARRAIEAMAQEIDDELAAGATLEEIAQTTDLELGEIAWTPAESGGIAGYEAFEDAARAVEEGDFPQVEGLGDGGLFALRLDGIRESAPRPFDEVRDQVEDDWTARQRRDALVARAEALAERIAAGESFADLGLEPQERTGLSRGAQVQGLPVGVVETVFEMEDGAVRALPGGDGAVIVRLDAVQPPAPDSEIATTFARQVEDQAANAVSEDLFRALAQDIQNRAGVEIDQQALNAVHANLP
ncbi:peptidylprolyl isomerase [Citreimonas salinaria]|uniref:Peptidyl-prolyl cis-trans isomerase D n=1 Tax=Citreimonas salinaria TaxID=321339 RepID=A0A1H3H5V2_9RHOB|nr:peptidylprolyl isomerase [Citreimonas salinaria]SDY10710.1 peptidyl-prolyl cis-trans isomerase D [Citreimonas salinaria]